MQKPKIVLLAVLTTVASTWTSCTRMSRDPLPASNPQEVDANEQVVGRDEASFGSSPASTNRQDLDINSGDLRYHYGSAGTARTTISESRLSREVRRLGIVIPETRKWRPMYIEAQNGGLRVRLLYPEVVQAGDRLLRLLDQACAPDDERRVFLERFMTSLRTESPDVACREGYIVLLEIADKYGLPTVLRPEVEASLRQSMMMREKGQ